MTLSAEDMAKYRQIIQETAPLLLRGHTASNNTKEFNVSALSSASTLNYSQSVPAIRQLSSKSISASSDWAGDYADSEETKNRALIRVIGTGMKNHMPRLLSVLNDLNGRMLFHKYKKDPLFYGSENNGDIELKTEEIDDEDAEIDYDKPHPRLLALQDSVPLTNSARSHWHYRGHWKLLNKLPLHLALRAYHERLVPPLDFCPRYLIKDSISQYLDRISVIMFNVRDLLHDAGMPVQFDLVIFPNDVVPNPQYKGDTPHNNDPNEADSKESGVDNESLREQLAVGMEVRAQWQDLKWYPAVIDECMESGKFVVTFAEHEDQREVSIGQIQLDSETTKPVMPSNTDLSARKMEHLGDTIGAVSDRLASLPKSYHDHLYKNLNKKDTKNYGTQNVFKLDGKLGVSRNARALSAQMKAIPFLKEGTRHGRYVCIIERPSLQSMDNDQVDDDEVDDGQVNETQTAESSESDIPDPSEPLKQRSAHMIRRTTVINLKDTDLKLIAEDEKEPDSQKETADNVETERVEKEKASDSPRVKKQLSAAAKAKADRRPDLLYLFQPPKPHGDIIHGVAMAEAMHSDTLEYLLPAIKGEKCPIGARHLCGGKMFCISFHMLSKDEIKCYLYIDQKCIRLNLNQNQPLTELMHILPHYFDDDEFVPLSIKDALLKAGFDDEVFHGVDQWMQQWHERKREIQLLNDLSQVQLKVEDTSSSRIVIEDPTPLGEYIIEECDWDVLDDEELNNKLLLFYRVLRELFSVPMDDDKWKKLTKINKEYSTSFFSTVDREYDEIRDKLVSNSQK